MNPSKCAQGILKRYLQGMTKPSNQEKMLHKKKEDAYPSQMVTKNTPMDVINPTHVGQPSNRARNISKNDEKGG